jgi:hypothetical protein
MFNMQLSLENTHQFSLSETCKFDMCLKPQAKSHEASRDTLPGKQEGVAWPEWLRSTPTFVHNGRGLLTHPL